MTGVERVQQGKPRQSEEAKLRTLMVNALDRRSFNPHELAYLLSEASPHIQTSLIQLIEHYCYLQWTRLQTGTVREGEYTATIVAARINDALSAYEESNS